MPKVKIYRLEKYRYPYHGPYWINEARMEDYDNTFNPSPLNDGIALIQGVDRSGFIDIDHLFSWFKDLEYYHKKNFVIGIYEVDEEHVKLGGRQCAFVYEEAMRIDVYEIKKAREIHE